MSGGQSTLEAPKALLRVKPHCQGKSRQTGEPCRQYAVPGRKFCHYHGGKNTVGPANNLLTTGRYSKYLPPRMAARYQEARSDPELLRLAEEIALVDSRLADLLGRVESGESGQVWAELAKAWAKFRTGENSAADASLVSDLIKAGNADYSAWGEIHKCVNARQRLVESERKRLVEAQQMVRVDQAMTLVAALLDSVKRNVRDPKALTAISADFSLLLINSGDSVGADREQGQQV